MPCVCVCVCVYVCVMYVLCEGRGGDIESMTGREVHIICNCAIFIVGPEELCTHLVAV